MEHRVAASGELSARALQPLLDPLFPGGLLPPGVVTHVIDLRAVRFISPGPLVTLATILAGRSPALPAVRLVVPDNADCRRYLAAAGFLQPIGECADIEGAADLMGYGPSELETVLPLTRLCASSEIPALLHRVEGRLDTMMGCGSGTWETTKRPILSTIRELCENVFQHADGSTGWIAAQRYQTKVGTPFVEVAIADRGRGIRRSLATRHTELLLSSDAQALERMLTEKLSRHSNEFRGTGYYVLQRATRELDGSFHLRSGAGTAERARRGSLQHHDCSATWPGTQLQARFTCVSASA